MALTAAMIGQVTTYLVKIQYLEIQISEVPYTPPILTPTIYPEIQAKIAEIQNAIYIAAENNYSREEYSALVYPLKIQLYDLIRQNTQIDKNNQILINNAQNIYMGLKQPIINTLNTVKDNFIAYLKSIKTEIQN